MMLVSVIHNKLMRHCSAGLTHAVAFLRTRTKALARI